ncbi:MAG: hypothetical protein IKR21_00400 [Oscillospiraceae bacterium]|nr:hypothetical protein [Oscillospiraceae bacterium]
MNTALRRILAILLALVLALSLAACGGSRAPEPEPEAPQETRAPEVIPEEPEPSVFETLADWSFVFSSGAGGWDTWLNIEPDGSFYGVFHDSDMGSTGPGYSEKGTLYLCKFTGAFSDPKELPDGSWEAKISSLEYSEEPDTEVIEKGQRIIYSSAYGLEDTDTVYFYLPGMKTADLPESYMEWISMTAFYGYGEDIPEELPFAGIFNPVGEYGFSSRSMLSTDILLTNDAGFPGLKNKTLDYNEEDGSYLCVDMDDAGLIEITNLCVYAPDDPDITEETGAFVDACVARVSGDLNVSNLAYWYGECSASEKLLNIDGYEPSVLATWTTGANEGTRFCSARMIHMDRFTYVYSISRSQYDELLEGDVGLMYLSSLTLAQLPWTEKDALSSAGQNGDVVSVILAYCQPAEGDETAFFADQAEIVHDYDEAALQEYEVTAEELKDGYGIFSGEVSFLTYPIPDSAPIYMLENGCTAYNHQYWHEELMTKLSASGKMPLMWLYLNDNAEVVFAYEAYFGDKSYMLNAGGGVSYDDAMAAYTQVLNKYLEAQTQGYSEEELDDMGFWSELMQSGWPTGTADDAVGYTLYDIDGNGIPELIISLYGYVKDIYSYNGIEAVYSYGCPYRGDVYICEEGYLHEIWGTMSSAQETIYRINDVTGHAFPMYEKTYTPTTDEPENVQCYVFTGVGSMEEIENIYLTSGDIPVWAWEWGNEITGEEYEETASILKEVELPEPELLADFTGLQ